VSSHEALVYWNVVFMDNEVNRAKMNHSNSAYTMFVLCSRTGSTIPFDSFAKQEFKNKVKNVQVAIVWYQASTRPCSVIAQFAHL
jgi:hypothetical protein